MNKEYLSEIIGLFVVKEKQDRFLQFLESSKRYEDLLWELLNDARNLNRECTLELLNSEHSPEFVVKRMRSLGANKKAYIVSINDGIDGKIGNLEQVMPNFYGFASGTLVYCIGTGVGYYESDSSRYLLQASK